jgi:hypothetical protein
MAIQQERINIVVVAEIPKWREEYLATKRMAKMAGKRHHHYG